MNLNLQDRGSHESESPENQGFRLRIHRTEGFIGCPGLFLRSILWRRHTRDGTYRVHAHAIAALLYCILGYTTRGCEPGAPASETQTKIEAKLDRAEPSRCATCALPTAPAAAAQPRRRAEGACGRPASAMLESSATCSRVEMTRPYARPAVAAAVGRGERATRNG